jgi:hypothetical protein
MRWYSSKDRPQGTASSYLKATGPSFLIFQIDQRDGLATAVFGFEADCLYEGMRF